MIISRTPLRISFVGGGSDLPAFYRRHGGAVLSMSIKKHVYLSMHDYFEKDGFILKYSRLETPASVEDIQHRIIRQVFKDMHIYGVDFNSSADVPAGTGLGSSSAFTVGLLNLCHAYKGLYASRAHLAEMACDVELNKLGEPIGKQDQYGCALGGINLIRFMEDDSVIHEVVPLTSEQSAQLERSLIMVYLGGVRSASALLTQQSHNSETDPNVIANLKAMTAQAAALKADLTQDIDALGPYLHEAWERKRQLSRLISSSTIDEVYARARAAGATGGKLLGAGGGGFLLLYCPEGARERVVGALSEFSIHKVELDHAGATIAYSD